MSKSAFVMVFLLIGLAIVLPPMLHDARTRPGAETEGSKSASQTAAGHHVVQSPVRIGESAKVAQAVARIRNALQRTVSVDINDAPLRTSVEQLLRSNGIAVEFDMKSFGDEGIDPDETLTIRNSNLSLQSALESILKPRSLDWYIDRESLIVTTSTTASHQFETRAYDITDLVRPLPNSSEPSCKPESLMQAIADYTEALWERTWGEGGELGHFQLGGTDLLFIRQTWRGHDEVEAFLENLRRMRRGDAPKSGRDAPIETAGKPILELLATDNPQLKLADFTPEQVLSLASVVKVNNEFAITLYQHVATQQDGNFVIAPHALLTGLQVVAEGARGETAVEFVQTLRILGKDWWFEPSSVRYDLEQLDRHLTPRTDSEDYQLFTANRLWGRHDEHFTRAFIARLGPDTLQQLPDLGTGQTSALRDAMNAWTAEKTNGLVPEIIGASDLNPDTRLLLTSAATMQEGWGFSRVPSRLADFKSGDASLRVPMMGTLDTIDHTHVDDAEALKLDYVGNQLSILILVPQQGTDMLSGFEKTLTIERLAACDSSLKSNYLKFELPRFQVRTHLALKDVLTSMGLKRAFDSKAADFTGMVNAADFCLSDVFHAASIDAEESGVGGGWGMTGPPAVPTPFVVDRPFIFLIRENETGCILFMGRIVNPLAR